VFELDANGYPAATSTTVYEGVEFEGGKAWTLNTPDVRRISHVGNDRVLGLDFLPPVEGLTAELRVATENQPLNAILMGVTEFTVGEAKMLAWMTENQGSEPDVGLLLYQQSLDKSTRLRRWRFNIAPKSRCIPALANMDENASEVPYNVALPPTTNHLWGTALADGTEGATEAALIEGMSESRPKIVAWKADGVATSFLFNTDYPAVNVNKMVVWANGVVQSETDAVTGVTFAAPPADGTMIVCFYEY
jgi:hypothetical protein